MHPRNAMHLFTTIFLKFVALICTTPWVSAMILITGTHVAGLEHETAGGGEHAGDECGPQAALLHFAA